MVKAVTSLTLTEDGEPDGAVMKVIALMSHANY